MGSDWIIETLLHCYWFVNLFSSSLQKTNVLSIINIFNNKYLIICQSNQEKEGLGRKQRLNKERYYLIYSLFILV